MTGRVFVPQLGFRSATALGMRNMPDMRNYTVTLKSGATPRKVTLERPMVSIRGPWEIRFRRPD